MSDTFLPGPSRARAAGLAVRSGLYAQGPEGFKFSVDESLEAIRQGKGDPDLIGWSVDVLHQAGLDGRNASSTKRKKIEAITDAWRTQTIYVDDPVNTEKIQTAAVSLCLRPGLCIRGGDCDDQVSGLGGALASIGIPVQLVYQEYGRGIQPHVLLLAHDGVSWIYIDASTNKPVGSPSTALYEQRYDPWKDSPSADYVGIGREGHAVNERRLVKVEGHWAERRYGTWFLHDGQAWSGLGAPSHDAGVGRVAWPSLVKSEIARVDAIWQSTARDVAGCGTANKLDANGLAAWQTDLTNWDTFAVINSDPSFWEFGLGSILDQVEQYEKLVYDWQTKLKGLSCEVSAPIEKPVAEIDKPLFQPLSDANTTSAIGSAFKWVAGAVVVGGVFFLVWPELLAWRASRVEKHAHATENPLSLARRSKHRLRAAKRARRARG